MLLNCKCLRFRQIKDVIPRSINHRCKRFMSDSQDKDIIPEEEPSPFRPSRNGLLRADKFFQTHGPRSVLEESGVKIKEFKKLKPIPEIAMIGRTSVGKSTLINVLAQQNKLARTSKRPGHTRLINYFTMGSKFYIVDLPGYGYVERLGYGSKHFVYVAENYLRHRAGKQLKSVCLLIDGKVGVQKNDLIAVEMLEEMSTPFHIVVTKTDKVTNPAKLKLTCSQINKELGQSTFCYPHIFQISAKQRLGISELRYFMALCTGVLEK